MNLTNRDKLISMCLPALVILLVYCGWFGAHKVSALNNKHKELVEAQAKALPQDFVQAQAAQVMKLAREVEQQQRELASCRQRWEAFAQKCALPEQRLERIERVDALLKQHQLTLIDDAEAEGNVAGRLPAAIEELGRIIAETAKNQKPQLRQFQFHGNYLDVHAVLQELSQGDVLAIPVGIAMKESKDNPKRHEWTLLVWI